MTTEEIDKAANEFAEKHGFRVPYDGSNEFYDKVDVRASKDGFKAGVEFTDKHWQEKSALNIADVMFSFLNFVREQKPTMVNHGEKISLFELERLVEKFKNRA